MFNFDVVCDMGSDKEQHRFVELQDELQPDDAINIQFTSGTTGNPKGATLTHVNILNNAMNTAHVVIRGGEIIYSREMMAKELYA